MERRLAAILAADMVGYSRLMAADEAGTLARQNAHRRELIDPKIAEYGGRLVKSTGDGVLVEFASVVDALCCAVTIQLAMPEREAASPEESRIAYRIGINLGDIIIEDDDIYGDGVNVAARLEALAEPGGICVSRTVADHVRGKVASDFEDRGEQAVKNIPEPVHVFGVLMQPEAAGKAVAQTRYRTWWRRPAAGAAVAALAIAVIGIMVWQPWAPDVRPASVERMALPLPDKPSIAVLPFDNLSGDAERERLVDGITEDIITDLSRYPDIFVIARNSTFTYKGKAVKVQQVAEDLGVHYVLEGSIQTDDGRARVTAQLIDALTGHHVWAERYERPLDDIFKLQDELTTAIVGAITGYSGQIANAEREIVRRKPPGSLTAFDYYLLGAEHKARFTKEDNSKAKAFLQKAIDLDPDFARAYVALAWSHVQDFEQGWTPSAAESVDKFRAVTLKAVQLDGTDAEAQLQLAMIYSWDDDIAGALRATRRAMELGPSNADVLTLAGWTLLYITDPGNAGEAVSLIERAMRLNPANPGWYGYALGFSQYFANRFEESIATLQRLRPATFQLRLYLAANYGLLGRDKEAAEIAESLLQENPQFSAREYAETIGIVDKKALAHFLDGMRKAGMPD
jgi:adenylate cyclase